LYSIVSGSFNSLDIQQSVIDATINDDVNLTCTISYESAAALMAANPSSQWSTVLNVPTSQQDTIIDLQQSSTTLILTSVDSNYCGTYSCMATDSFVAQPSTGTATVSVGK